ncbi:cysteinyl-tRNA synthetase [Serendipita sp. 405]|nr:cysteinyl-tRNA synthetase [Serendipita sp. 405]
MLRRPSHIGGHDQWPLVLNHNDLEEFQAVDLAPLDPRTQDPNIAPWADIPEEEEEAHLNLPTPGSSSKRIFSNKTPSFSLGAGSIFSRQQQNRNSEGQESQAGPSNEGKKSFLNIKSLRRKNSKPSLSKEPSLSIPSQPVPSLPGATLIPPRSPPSPPGSRRFRKSSKQKPPPVPPKDHADDIVLDTNFDSLEGIVDSSRIGTDSRVSLTHDGPISGTQWDDGHSNSHGDSYPRRGASTSAHGHGAMSSTDSRYEQSINTANAAALLSIPPTTLNGSAFTNPFAAPATSSTISRRRPDPLRVTTTSPSSKGLMLPPPHVHSNGTYPHLSAISPTDKRDINDPGSPSWVAPESWAVKMGAEEDARSESGESDNLQLQEPIRQGTMFNPEDESVHDAMGRQSTSAGTIEYKIRILFETDTTSSPLVFKVPYSETAQSFIKTKFISKVRGEGEYRLWIRDKGRDRMLAGTERILPLLRKRLVTAGYEDDEQLANIAGEDLGHIFKLIVRDVSWRQFSEEPASVANPTFIDMSAMNLIKIPILLHKVAQHIVLLNLSRNIGIDLPSDFVQSCEALRELKLSGVGLRRVPPAIRHSRQLARLDISSNRISDLEDSGLNAIPTLASLKLHCNRLTNLPNYFASMHNIKDLNVSNNKFDGFPDVLFSMTSLLDLDVSFNNIRVFPPGIGRLVNLQKLTLMGNQLTAFTPECAKLVNLEVLDCRRNMITDLSLLTNLPKLKLFRAHYNAVHILDVALGPCMTELKAPHNQITRFKLLEVPHMIALQHLDLSYTKLSSLDEDVVAQLTNLNTLRLDHNHLRTLPASLCKLIYLQHLSCTNNDLDELPNDIGNLDNLQILDVHSNSLRQIPASIWQCKNLYLFNATSNLIDVWRNPPSGPSQGSTSLPSGPVPFGSFSEATLHTNSPDSERRPSNATLMGRTSRRALPLELSLQKLYLSDNSLRDDTLQFLSRLSQLRVLNISFNELQDLSSTLLSRLPLLEELYLSGNKLSALPVEGMQGLTKLHTLYLNGNRLQTLPSALNKIPSLTVLDVGSNNLRYNINNWHFDWNWNFNRNLKYLSLSGNQRLEIRPENTKRNQFVDRSEGPVLHEFNALTQLKVLGLMDVTTGFINSIPDDNEERRVRTSGSEINGMGYGIADTMGKTNQLSMFDIVVPSFRMHDNECLFGMYGRPESTHGNTRLTKFVQDRFHSELIMKLNQLRPELEEGVVEAFRRAFLSMNRELYKFLTNSSSGQFARKMSTASTSSAILAPTIDALTLKAGLSAVILYIVGKTMYVANVGNSLAVISRQGEARLVSTRHDPLESGELRHIRATDGWISQKELLNDELNVSRSFGMYHLLPSVVARPAVWEHEITDQDEFVIVGNSNLWDYLPYRNAVDIARQCRDPMIAAQKLRDAAISYGADGSVMVMVLNVSDLFPAKAVQRKNAIETGEFGGFKSPLRGNNELISSKMLNRLPDEVDAPVGTVALVFTDIANSTHLWEKNAGMRTAMLMHNELLRRQLLTIGGYLVKTEGDAFMCSFPSVVSALYWSLAVQVALLKLDWPLEILESKDGREIYDENGMLLARGLSVRMGIHWGAPLCEPDFYTHRMDYFGPMVNRSARITGSAKGGQIMISNDVIKELSKHFPLDDSSPPPPPKPADLSVPLDADAAREQEQIEALRRMQFTIIPVGERKLKGIEAPEALSLVWPNELKGRLSLMHDKEEEEASGAAADANSRVPFSVEQMKQLAMLCVRLETLTSGRVLKAAPKGKRDRPPTPAGVATLAIVAEEGDNLIDIVPGDNGLRRPTMVHRPPPSEEVEEKSIYLVANPELLMPSFKEGATDEHLMLLLDSLSLRIDNALASLYLKQKGGFPPLARPIGRVGSVVAIEGGFSP